MYGIGDSSVLIIKGAGIDIEYFIIKSSVLGKNLTNGFYLLTKIKCENMLRVIVSSAFIAMIIIVLGTALFAWLQTILADKKEKRWQLKE